MKYDPTTKRAIRDEADKERHRQVRERLTFSHKPTVSEVEAVVDQCVREGLLSSHSAASDLAALADALRGERERQGLSLHELADKAGLDEASIRNLEAGATGPSLQTWMDLAEALGKRLRWSVVDAR